MDCSTPSLPVPHHLLEFAQVHVHCISYAIQPSYPLLPSSPSAFSLSQHQVLFQWVGCSHQVDKPRQRIKKQTYHFANERLYCQSYSCIHVQIHVQMWELDHKEGWTTKNWCFQIVVLEKTLESPLNFKEIRPVNPKGNQPWIFIGRTDAEVETVILWPPNAKSQLIGKDPDAGKERRQEEKGMTGSDDWMASPTQWTWAWANSEIVKDGEAWQVADHGVAKSWKWLSNWTTIPSQDPSA